jgi:hypothetical protein
MIEVLERFHYGSFISHCITFMFEMQIAQLIVFLYAIVPNLFKYIPIYLLFLLQIYLYLDWNIFEACIPLLQ